MGDDEERRLFHEVLGGGEGGRAFGDGIFGKIGAGLRGQKANGSDFPTPGGSSNSSNSHSAEVMMKKRAGPAHSLIREKSQIRLQNARSLLAEKKSELECQRSWAEDLRRRLQDLGFTESGLQEYTIEVEKNMVLCAKVREMNLFFEEYGLGSFSLSAESTRGELLANNTCYQFCKSILDSEEFSSQIRDLNRLMIISPGADQAKMQLIFWSQGMEVSSNTKAIAERGPAFRKYQDPAMRCFLQDILDGYFPSELEGSFPNGVHLQVRDRRREDYVGTLGYRLGDGKKIHRMDS